MTEKIVPGVGFIRHAGEITTPDGAEIKGCIVEFPAGPPDMTIDVIFKELPVRLIREEEYQRLWRAYAAEQITMEEEHG